MKVIEVLLPYLLWEPEDEETDETEQVNSENTSTRRRQPRGAGKLAVKDTTARLRWQRLAGTKLKHSNVCYPDSLLPSMSRTTRKKLTQFVALVASASGSHLSNLARRLVRAQREEDGVEETERVDFTWFEDMDVQETHADEVWSFLQRHQGVVGAESSEAMAWSYLYAIEEHDMDHPIALLLYTCLNFLAASEHESIAVLQELLRLKTKYSYKQYNGAKKRFLACNYADEHPVVTNYTGNVQASPVRMAVLTVVVLLLLIANMYVYVFKHQLFSDAAAAAQEDAEGTHAGEYDDDLVFEDDFDYDPYE